MSAMEWSVIIGWPVVVVILNNLLTGLQVKHMAETTCESFHKTGRALAIAFASIKSIEEALKGQGIVLADSIGGRDDSGLWSIARQRPGDV